MQINPINDSPESVAGSFLGARSFSGNRAMTQLSILMNLDGAEIRDPEQCVPRELATYVTATVVYSLSGATIFLLATFIRSI
jgi:hypothetical protein